MSAGPPQGFAHDTIVNDSGARSLGARLRRFAHERGILPSLFGESMTQLP